MEVAVGFALLSAPERLHELLEPTGFKIPSVREVKGLRDMLG